MQAKFRAKRKFDEAALGDSSQLVALPLSELASDEDGDEEKEKRPGDVQSKAIRAKIAERRILVFSSRGLVSRFRHLMLDLRKLLPHHKTDVKFDMRNNLHEIDEICEMKSCRNCLFFECRKKKDLFMWASRSPTGPSIKFHISNVHTMAELKFTGNCLLGSRPILIFDKIFDESPHWMLVKSLFTQMFATPPKHPKSKPFVDHAITFFVLDGRIWFRHYQVVTHSETQALKAANALKKGNSTQFEHQKPSLVEIGPRFVMDIVRVFGSSFGGKTLYQNPAFVSPNQVRSIMNKRKSKKYQKRQESRISRRDHVSKNPMPKDELEDVFG